MSSSSPKAAPYFSADERKAARRLVRAIRQSKYVIRHSDGEDVTDCADKTEAEIMELLSQTGVDHLTVLEPIQAETPCYRRVGTFMLIGQGPEGSGDELVSDYSWSQKDEAGSKNEAEMERLWKIAAQNND